MDSTDKQERSELVDNARYVAQHLTGLAEGTPIQIRPSSRLSASRTDTDGWAVEIGNLGKGRPTLEIWLDRFSGHPERRFYACFWSRSEEQIEWLCRKAAKELWPVRRIVFSDTDKKTFHLLRTRLRDDEFNTPIVENYHDAKSHFFGFYEQHGLAPLPTIDSRFCERAALFFVDIARSLPKSKEATSSGEAYARCENRKWVKSHLRRERSSFLSAQCKERDNYRCQVCTMSFTEDYGAKLGDAFAEAHHLVHLGKQQDKVKTKLDDLITVCANCHRMLHRMDGNPSDVKKLRAIVCKLRK